MINCTESSLLSPITEGGISEARRDVYKVVLCVIPPRTFQTDSKISRTVYQHVPIVKPAGSDQNAAREAKQFHGMSGLKFLSSNFNSYPSFKTANTNSIHVSLPKINHQSLYSCSKFPGTRPLPSTHAPWWGCLNLYSSIWIFVRQILPVRALEESLRTFSTYSF